MSGQLDLIDGGGLAEQANRSALAEIAGRVMEERTATNTDKAYRSDWRTWTAFVQTSTRAGAAVDPLVADRRAQSDALVVYAGWLGKGGRMPDGEIRTPSAPETIRRKLTGVLAGWRAHDVDYPRNVTERARQWVDHYAKTLIEAGESTGRGSAELVTPAQLRLIARATPDDLGGLRDMALLTIGFAIGGRTMELAHLEVSDITAHERGIRVHVRKTKGRSKPRQPFIPFGQYPETCPVRCWRRWRDASAIVTGPAIRQVRYGRLGGRMSPEAIADRVTVSGQRADLRDLGGDPIRLTGHSLRRGLATAAKEAGYADHKIADAGGWTRGSTALQRYIDDVTGWDDNVLIGIGL